MAKTHYSSLLASGVKIYEYSPGFVHAKVFLADDKEAVVGTINLDYRSLYHHFECAAFLYDTPCLTDIRSDMEETMAKSTLVEKNFMAQESLRVRLTGFLMKGLAPLL